MHFCYVFTSRTDFFFEDTLLDTLLSVVNLFCGISLFSVLQWCLISVVIREKLVSLDRLLTAKT